MYDFIELLSDAVRERGERFERGVARRRANRTRTATLRPNIVRPNIVRPNIVRPNIVRSNSATDPAWGTSDVGPKTEPLTVIPQPVPASHHIAARNTGLGRLAY